MPVLYLTEQGATLKKEGETLLITKEGQTLQKVQAIKVEQVVLFGNVNLTTPVIHYFLLQGIDCVFCSSHGRYHGRLFSTESPYGMLRARQLQVALDTARRLAVAKDVVRGKTLNQRTLLMRYQREKNLPALQRAIDACEGTLKQVEKAEDLGQLLGLEGSMGNAYFSAFKELLGQDLGFNARVRRPPTDPVNSLLSFGYTLLGYGMQSAVHIVGLDPFMGFLHAPERSRPNLALDLIEEFRAIIVDSIVLRAINTRAITQAHFRKGDADEPMAVLLTQAGMRAFIQMYEERVETRIMHPVTQQQVTYRRCFELQARQLARVVLGEAEAYRPFLVR